MTKAADVNYQSRAREFSVNDTVVPVGMLDSQSGRVVAVWPAIGMVEVEMLSGVVRYPAEDLQLYNADGNPVPPGSPKEASLKPSPSRVAMYWADRDRKYKMTKAEHECGKPSCPRCKDAPALKRCVFRRTEGQSERLLGCPQCMFLIHDSDILNFTLEEALALDEGSTKLARDPASMISLEVGTLPVSIETTSRGDLWTIRLFVGNRLVRILEAKSEGRAEEAMVGLKEYLLGRGGFAWRT